MTSYLDLTGLRYFVQKLREQYYPIGTIYISTSPKSPAELIGGSWELYAPGRTLVGVSKNDEDFSAGTIGGEKAHMLKRTELPHHRHSFAARSSGDSDASTPAFTVTSWQYPGIFYSNGYWQRRSGQTMDESESGVPDGYTQTAANNLPPYISVYMWRRIS